MFVKFALTVFLLSIFSLVIIPLPISADHDPNEPHIHNVGCRENSDCGADSSFVCDRGTCSCPGPDKKPFIVIPEAKPQCQKIANLGESCDYSKQCSEGTAGALSRCKNNKCQCYDTENSGRDVIRPYSGTCYRATAKGEECETGNQCKAFIEPEDHVECFSNSTIHRSYCRCIEGQHCEEKSGAATVVLSITFAFLGIMATQVVL